MKTTRGVPQGEKALVGGQSPKEVDLGSFYAGDLFGEIDLAETEAATQRPRGLLLIDLFPGVILCATLAIAAAWMSDHYGPPTILIALLLGLALNFAALDPRTHRGLDLVGREGLRIGIVLIGFQVTLGQIAGIGLIPFLALLCIAAFAFSGGMLGARLSGQSRFAGILAGGATAICGASAALALYGVIGRDRLPQAQFALTLVGVALASALAMASYPILAAQLGLGDRAAGFLIGASVHDVAQAIGGGYSYSNVAGTEATIVKLARVALLAPVVLIVSLWIGKPDAHGAASSRKFSIRGMVPPWFVTGFVLAVAVNSAVTFPVEVASLSETSAKILLVLAVTATALRSRTDLIARLGWRAFIPVLGATLASFVSALLFVLFLIGKP